MGTSQISIMAAIIIYLLSVLAVGVIYIKKNNTVDDFYLGGRKLGPFVTAMSAEASDMSSWLLMGLPGVAYLSGVADAFWTAIGLAIGTYVNWLIVAKRIRHYSHIAGDAITLPDFFSKRYRDKNNILTCLAAIIIVIFFIPYTASGFAACGKLFYSLFGVDYVSAMIISAVVIVGYTALGGFLAASVTDFMQSIVMTIALVVVVTFGITSVGGLSVVMDNAMNLPGYLSLTSSYNVADDTASAYGFITIISTLAWGVGYFGMPHILLRFMAIGDVDKLNLSRRVATAWVIVSLGVAVFIGIVGYAMSQAGVIEILIGSNSETIIVKIASVISSHGIFPSFIAGIILAGILAATMSTADSQLLAAASSVSQNLLQDFLGIELSERTSMLVARATVIVIAVVAAFIAKDPDSSVFNIVSFAWAGFGAAFGPVVLFSLFWRRSNKWGALAGMFFGGSMVFVWKYLIRPLGGVWNIYELLPAFLIACLAIVMVSLLTEAPSDEIIKEFDMVAERS